MTEPRLDYFAAAPAAMKAMLKLENAVQATTRSRASRPIHGSSIMMPSAIPDLASSRILPAGTRRFPRA